MKLSIIIPVFNEEKNIKRVINEVSKAPISLSREIIIVDDGSQDKTRDILKRYRNRKDIKIVLQPENHGKGAAIRAGIKEVSGDIVLIQDADLEYSIADYPKILAPLVSGQEKVVYGSRFLGKIQGMNWKNRIANKILTITVNLFYGAKITDEATAYKVFKTSVIKKITLKCERFEFCPEVTAKILKKGIKIYEVPISYRGRTKNEGKKINWRDGFVAFWTLIKYRFKD
jgi:dolichol-phosphate mannosyltransferase